MRKISYLFLLAITAIAFVSCNKTSYKKTPGGMPYKIYRSKDTQLIVPGDYIKIAVTQKINDSMVLSTYTALPVYLFISNQNQQRYDISELWTSLHKGDSLVSVQMMDTFIKRSPGNIPPHLKNGDRIITTVKIMNVFKSDTAARVDEEAGRVVFLANEIAGIEKFLSEKKITAQKTTSGAYVEIIKEGTGDLIDSGKYVRVNYSGTSWSGKKFDSNTDTSFHHVEPYGFTVGAQQMIRGFDEAMFFMRKGSVVKTYIPSTLAYGPSPTSPNIKPYENLVFEIEVVDLMDKAPDVNRTTIIPKNN